MGQRPRGDPRAPTSCCHRSRLGGSEGAHQLLKAGSSGAQVCLTAESGVLCKARLLLVLQSLAIYAQKQNPQFEAPPTPSSGGWSLNSKLWEKLGPQARPANLAFPLEVFHSRGLLTWKVDARTPKILHPVHSSESCFHTSSHNYFVLLSSRHRMLI